MEHGRGGGHLDSKPKGHGKLAVNTHILGLTVLLLTPPAPLHAAVKQPTKPGLALKLESERDITSLTMAGEPGHAATIAQTTSGAILAAWWSGMERAPETDIWM